jgi:hypothetical protein
MATAKKNSKNVKYELFCALSNEVEQRLELERDDHEWLMSRILDFLGEGMNAMLDEVLNA